MPNPGWRLYNRVYDTEYGSVEWLEDGDECHHHGRAPFLMWHPYCELRTETGQFIVACQNHEAIPHSSFGVRRQVLKVPALADT